MSVEQNRAILEEGVAAFNRGDLDGWWAIHDADVIAHGFAPGPIGFEGVKGFYTGLATAFPSGVVSIDDTVAEGDSIAWRFTTRGMHEAEFLGVAATGKSVVITGHALYRFRDGLIIERWTRADLLGLLVQLGAVEAPV